MATVVRIKVTSGVHTFYSWKDFYKYNRNMLILDLHNAEERFRWEAGEWLLQPIIYFLAIAGIALAFVLKGFDPFFPRVIAISSILLILFLRRKHFYAICRDRKLARRTAYVRHKEREQEACEVTEDFLKFH